jgi:hypothetical protein
MFRIDFGRKRTPISYCFAHMASSSSCSSSSSSPPLTEDDKAKFNRIRPKAAALTYEEIGYVSEEVMNGLKNEWKLSFEKYGILQSIWNRHPSNTIKKQGKKKKKEFFLAMQNKLPSFLLPSHL